MKALSFNLKLAVLQFYHDIHAVCWCLTLVL